MRREKQKAGIAVSLSLRRLIVPVRPECYSLSIDMLQKPISALVSIVISATLLVGCGSDQYYPDTPTTIGGNYLLAGSLPILTSTGFSYAVTLDVTGDQLLAAQSFSFYCTQGSADVSLGLPESLLGANRSFELETPGYPGAPPYIDQQLQGIAPTAGLTPWSGSYAFSNVPAGCDLPAGANFTAVPIGYVTGTYAGSFAMNTANSSTTVPLMVQLNLKQGGQPSDGTRFSYIVMTGSIEVTGSACVSSGTITSSDQSSIGGDFVSLTFSMNDGSTLQMQSYIKDTGVKRLLLNQVSVTGGVCNYTSTFPNTDLVMQ